MGDDTFLILNKAFSSTGKSEYFAFCVAGKNIQVQE